MRGKVRKFLWVVAFAALVLGLTAGALWGHDGRQVGEYRFIVGWLEEPTYEGSTNAVSIRVNQIVEGVDDGHFDDGHTHGEEDSHGSSSMQEDNEHDHSDHEHEHEADEHLTGTHSHQDEEHGNDEGHRHDKAVEASAPLTVDVEVSNDSVSGLNVHVITTGMRFAPRSVNQENVDGEGHGHIYVDGAKIGRLYSPWFHLDGLEPGTRELKVTLTANDHSAYTWNDQPVEVTTRIRVPETDGEMARHGDTSVAASARMSVSIEVEPDEVNGANLFVTDTTGFEFTPELTGDHHHSGEGHATVYVNDVFVSRLYGSAIHLGQMAAGPNDVRVVLNSNVHGAYSRDGEAVQDEVSVTIPEAVGGPGYEANHHSHSHSSNQSNSNSAPGPGGATKPLAGMSTQAREAVVGVEGLEGSLQVEVRHVASGVSRTLPLMAVPDDPGHYTAALIPTARGVYEFRVFGDLEGMSIDELFSSMGGGGRFDDVQSAAELQFPVAYPETRELESGMRGALQSAQQAQDAAQAALEGSGGNALSIVALVIGIAGAALGALGVFIGLRGRQSR